MTSPTGAPTTGGPTGPSTRPELPTGIPATGSQRASSPTSARRAHTRQRLVAAAIPVIAQKGVLGCSVEEICEAAGFTRGAFYSNFDSKDDLCVAILAAQGDRYLRAARDAIAGLDPHRPVSTQIGDATTHFIAAASSDADTVLVMSELRLYAAREPAVRDAFRDVDAESAALFAEAITQALRAQGLSLALPVADALGLLHAVHDQTALDQLVRGESPSAPVAAERLSVVLRSLVTDAPPVPGSEPA